MGTVYVTEEETVVRQLTTYQSHFFEGSRPKDLSTLGLNIQEVSDGNYY